MVGTENGQILIRKRAGANQGLKNYDSRTVFDHTLQRYLLLKFQAFHDWSKIFKILHRINHIDAVAIFADNLHHISQQCCMY